MIQEQLKGKKIALIMPKFFGYEKRIKSALEMKGAEVFLFNERPGDRFLIKALIRKSRFFVRKIIRRNYNNIINQLSNHQMDYIFFINPESLLQQHIEDMKSAFPKAKFILYMWDSVKNKKNIVKILHNFDRIFSFDKNDAKYYGFKHRPLFFTKESTNNSSIKYDVCFIGTIHSDRYKIIENIFSIYLKSRKKIFRYYYLQHKYMFFVQKTFNENFRNARFNEFQLKPMNYETYSNIISESRVILDIEHPKQTGLTMRTIEMIGLKKKIITTNKEVKSYDFYSPDNICVIERDEINIPDDFLDSEYKDLENDIYYKYSIEGWIDDIFCK